MTLLELLNRTNEKVVPPHLRSVYPFDFATFLASLVVLLFYWSPAAPTSVLLFALAVASAVALFAGWLLDAPVLTKHGAIVAAVMWSGQAAYLIAAYMQGTLGMTTINGAAYLTSALASGATATGVFTILVTHQSNGHRGARWWIARRRRG